MSAVAAPDGDAKEAIAEAREHRERFERLADSDLPYAPYAERILKLLDREATDD